MGRPLVLPPLKRTGRDAEVFAKAVHDGQADKAGRPYWRHLKAVSILANDKLPWHASDAFADRVDQIAWLHDVIEDTEYTAKDLLDEGFHRTVVAAVEALTKPKGCLRYLDWIEHIGMTAELPAILVKLADNEDNSRPERLALLPPETADRLRAKYASARPVLVAAAERYGWRDERKLQVALADQPSPR